MGHPATLVSCGCLRLARLFLHNTKNEPGEEVVQRRIQPIRGPTFLFQRRSTDQTTLRGGAGRVATQSPDGLTTQLGPCSAPRKFSHHARTRPESCTLACCSCHCKPAAPGTGGITCCIDQQSTHLTLEYRYLRALLFPERQLRQETVVGMAGRTAALVCLPESET